MTGPLDFLIGIWTGEGKGSYPTIDAFRYGEEITVRAVEGKPFLAYTQRTWNLETKAPMHGEVGYWRAPAEGRVELVLAHPTGVTEIQEGTTDGSTIDLRSTSIALTSTAKPVTELRRRFRIDGDALEYEVDMAAVGEPVTRHLEAVLRRA